MAFCPKHFFNTVTIKFHLTCKHCLNPKSPAQIKLFAWLNRDMTILYLFPKLTFSMSSSTSPHQGCVTPRTTATLRPRRRAPWRSCTARSPRCSAPWRRATRPSTWWWWPSPSRMSSPITRTWCPSSSRSTPTLRTSRCPATVSTPATTLKVNAWALKDYFGVQ